MRTLVGGRAKKKSAASVSHMSRFETHVLTHQRNLDALLVLQGQWIDRVHERKPIREIILDLDSSVSETYGEQEGSEYNGHFGCERYHPLFCFNQFGDLWFEDNQVRLQLFALAYNLGNFLRRLALPRAVSQWSMTTLREKLIKIGAKVVSHSRYTVFQLAEVAVSRNLFQAILSRAQKFQLLRPVHG